MSHSNVYIHLLVNVISHWGKPHTSVIWCLKIVNFQLCEKWGFQKCEFYEMLDFENIIFKSWDFQNVDFCPFVNSFDLKKKYLEGVKIE